MIFKKVFPFIIAAVLTCIALIRCDFSIPVISGVLEKGLDTSESLPLNQPFSFLARGRQSFAFVSQDGQFVLKFFNQKYFQMPWYASALLNREKESVKRKKREKFFRESYLTASKVLKEQTGLLYCHFEKTNGLPKVCVKDRASRLIEIDLNEVPFVLQRRGEPFYPTLEKIYVMEGKEAFLRAIQAFMDVVAYRIDHLIEDGDHDVEHNYGFLNGKPFQLDPGRLLFADFSDSSKRSHEWWVATHSFRKWLEKKYPDMLSEFDKIQETYTENDSRIGF